MSASNSHAFGVPSITVACLLVLLLLSLTHAEAPPPQPQHSSNVSRTSAATPNTEHEQTPNAAPHSTSSHSSIESRSNNHEDDDGDGTTKGAGTGAGRSRTVRIEDPMAPFKADNVFPVRVAGAIPTKFHIMQELMAWAELTPFATWLMFYPHLVDILTKSDNPDMGAGFEGDGDVGDGSSGGSMGDGDSSSSSGGSEQDFAEHDDHLILAPTIGAILHFVDSLLNCTRNTMEGRQEGRGNDDNGDDREKQGSSDENDGAQPARQIESDRRRSEEAAGAGRQSSMNDIGPECTNCNLDGALNDGDESSMSGGREGYMGGSEEGAGDTMDRPHPLPPLGKIWHELNGTIQELWHVFHVLAYALPDLEEVMRFHIVPGAWTEDAISTASKLPTLTHRKKMIDVSQFWPWLKPSLGGDENPAVRLYRQTKPMGGRVMVIDKILMPFKVEELCPDVRLIPELELPKLPAWLLAPLPSMELLDPHGPSKEVDRGDQGERPGDNVIPDGGRDKDPMVSAEAGDDHSMGMGMGFGNGGSLLGPLPMLPPLYPYASVLAMLMLRTDMRIFYAMVMEADQARETLAAGLDGRGLVHVFVPSDTAFSEFIGGVATTLAEQVMGVAQEVDRVEDFVERVMMLLGKIESLPTLEDAVMYHMVHRGRTAGELEEELIRNRKQSGGVATLASECIRQQDESSENPIGRGDGSTGNSELSPNLYFRNGRVYDGDDVRDGANILATFATLDGYVSVIDTVLTCFDGSVWRTVMAAAVNEMMDEVKDEERAKGASETAESTSSDSGSNRDASSGSDGECLPGGALVTLRDGRVIEARELHAGMHVAVGTMATGTSHEAGADSDGGRVIGFTHREEHRIGSFVSIELASGGRPLVLTRGHYVPLDGTGTLVAAGALMRGDVLRRGNGSAVTVASVTVTDVGGEVRAAATVGPVTTTNAKKVARTETRRRRKGLYAPVTVSGSLVVEDVVVSAYSTAVHPKVAHALLAPVRAAVRWFGCMEPLGQTLYGGAPQWVLWLMPRGGERHEL